MSSFTAVRHWGKSYWGKSGGQGVVGLLNGSEGILCLYFSYWIMLPVDV